MDDNSYNGELLALWEIPPLPQLSEHDAPTSHRPVLLPRIHGDCPLLDDDNANANANANYANPFQTPRCPPMESVFVPIMMADEEQQYVDDDDDPDFEASSSSFLLEDHLLLPTTTTTTKPSQLSSTQDVTQRRRRRRRRRMGNNNNDDDDESSMSSSTANTTNTNTNANNNEHHSRQTTAVSYLVPIPVRLILSSPATKALHQSPTTCSTALSSPEAAAAALCVSTHQNHQQLRETLASLSMSATTS